MVGAASGIDAGLVFKYSKGVRMKILAQANVTF